MALVGHITNTEAIRYIKNHFGRNEGKHHFDRLNISGKEILKWTEKTYSVKGNPVLTWLITKTMRGLE
jgi:hypothetical protein